MVRSRPATASVSWVPIDDELDDGRDHEGEKHDVLHVAADGRAVRQTTSWAPRYITSAPTTPRTAVEASDMSDWSR